MKSLLLQRIISDTLLRLVTLDSFVLDAEWVLHKFQMQFDGKSLACEKQVCHWSKLPTVLVITTLPSVVLLTTIDWPMTLRIGRPHITSRREDNALGWLVRRNPFANSEKTVVAPSVAICKNNPKSSEICWLLFKKTCKEMCTNTSTQSFLFAMVPNTSSMEFGLLEESSLVRRKSFLVARDRWQSACMATTEHCLCWE